MVRWESSRREAARRGPGGTPGAPRAPPPAPVLAWRHQPPRQLNRSTASDQLEAYRQMLAVQMLCCHVVKHRCDADMPCWCAQSSDAGCSTRQGSIAGRAEHQGSV